MATVAVFVCGVEYFAPSDSECIFRCFELPLLLFQAMRSGDEPFVEVLLLQQLVRREIVRTVIFAGDGLFIQVVLFGWLLESMFVVPVRPALWLGLYGCCLCRGGVWRGASAATLIAFRGNDPSLRPFDPRRCFF